MNWPFVSRARLDLALHNLQEMRALHRADVQWYQARIDDLTDKYHALRVAGGQPATAMPVPEFDRVREAIVERAGGNLRLERHLMREAAKLRIRNKTEDEIIGVLTDWRDPSADEESA